MKSPTPANPFERAVSFLLRLGPEASTGSHDPPLNATALICLGFVNCLDGRYRLAVRTPSDREMIMSLWPGKGQIGGSRDYFLDILFRSCGATYQVQVAFQGKQIVVQSEAGPPETIGSFLGEDQPYTRLATWINSRALGQPSRLPPAPRPKNTCRLMCKTVPANG